MFGWFKGFRIGNIIQDVPIELAQCEFNCRSTNCQNGASEKCKNRLLALEREATYAKAISESAATDRNPPGTQRN